MLGLRRAYLLEDSNSRLVRMIISHKHRFIFVKTRKTAGTSIEIALSKYCGPEDVITRIPVEDERIRSEFGGRAPQNIDVPIVHYTPRDWARLLIRRNKAYPFAEHSYATRIRHYIGSRTYRNYFKFCVERNPWDKVISYWHYREGENSSISLRDYIMNVDLPRTSDWERYTHKDRLIVDRVIRYENLRTELPAVCRELGVPWTSELPRAKGHYRTDRRPYWVVLGNDERRRIAEVYAREIEHFGFQFGPEEAA